MAIPWQQIFSKDGLPWQGAVSFSDFIQVRTLPELKKFLDAVHIRFCLVKPYYEQADYPLVEARELLPSFDNDMWEYKDLPGFALVAFARPLEYFSEVFQYDNLHPLLDVQHNTAAACPLEPFVLAQNVQTICDRLPRVLQENFRQNFAGRDTSVLDYYPALLPYLLQMDRAQVMALDSDNLFHLAGVFASFPSDIDSEIKRFGIRMGKFAYGNNALYERNRMFVYQYLMELYGFPVVSERRTSSALFARRLHKMGENFLLRVLGQTDRTITTYWAENENRRYPWVEKIALIAVDQDQTEVIKTLKEGGYFVDEEKRVIIIRITYRQHVFSPSNVRQDRALSVALQEVLHPLTGQALQGLNIIKDTTNMLLRLSDIVRGEHTGRVIYKRTEVVENTDTDEKRLKFLYCWLTKHQRRMVGYSDDFFTSVSKVVAKYLYSPENDDVFDGLRDLHRDVCNRFSYIQQARKIRLLEDIRQRNYKGQRITYLQMTTEAVSLLTDLSFDITTYFPSLVDTAILSLEGILSDRYLIRKYLGKEEKNISSYAAEVRKNYGRLVSLLDKFTAVRKARAANEPKN
ncbi:MAG: hypothetical protein PHN64_05475 [Desulfovibrionaceae bacterium]|nr:hypothetical protein [Desulfovibrionaceae bacterium]